MEGKPMNRKYLRIGAPMVALSALLVACERQEAATEPAAAAAPAPADPREAMIADALSAAPPSIAATAMVMDWEGNMLKENSGPYTCMPTPVNLNGRAPMCMDGPWMAWADAWSKHKEFTAEHVGISYMLGGDGGASNTDPYATGPTADNQWVVEGPHLMILVPDPATLEGISTDPNNGGPYVMWKGTPYAHIMVPTAD
jgi:hypothetical protein